MNAPLTACNFMQTPVKFLVIFFSKATYFKKLVSVELLVAQKNDIEEKSTFSLAFRSFPLDFCIPELNSLLLKIIAVLSYRKFFNFLSFKN